MALRPLRLPRLNQGLAIVDNKGRPSSAFVRYWNVELLAAIERSIDGLAELQDQQALQLAAIQALQAQQASQLLMINEALELAGIAVELAGGNAGSANGVFTVNDSGWTEGPQVDLTGVVAGDLTIPGTGLQIVAATRSSNFPDVMGQLRIVEIDGVTETVVGGPWNFVCTRYDPNPAIPPSNMSNPSEIPGFTVPLTTTGALSYRLDAIMDATFTLTDVKFYIFARRST